MWRGGELDSLLTPWTAAVTTTAPAFRVSLVTMETLQGDAGGEHPLLAAIRRDLDDVDAVLAKLDKGTYGRCEACGGPVGDERLTRSPAERFCAAHEHHDPPEAL